jgi:Flp pilus assembly protein TadD
VALAKFSLNRNYRVEEDGLPAARQLVLLEPRNPVYLDLLGTAYLTLGDLDSAERFFLQALALDPEEAAILIHLGQTSLYRGDTELGLGYLRRASAAAGDERLREMADRLLGEYGAK